MKKFTFKENRQVIYFVHKWKFDLPWHMVKLKDWFYMVNVGYIHPIHFLHVRILGIRSLWGFSEYINSDEIKKYL